MTGKGKRTFWVTTAPTALHQERVNLLNQSGFDVILCAGVSDVINGSNEQRPSCVFFDTPANDSEAGVQSILQIAAMPELNGARFILSSTHDSPEAIRVAVSENFRDIIPLKLSAAAWLQRVQYATSAKPTSFKGPLCEISMNQIAVASAPARLIWINETHARIECRGSQRVGSTMQISGALASTFGVPHISLTVESIHRDQLLHRFSQALVCKWRVAGASAEKAATLIRRMQTDQGDQKLRAYIAVARSDIRSQIVENLPSARFDLKVGLQRSSVAQEFKYFSPDIVFMDDKLFATLDDSEITDMFSSVPGDVPLVVYGAGTDSRRVRGLLGSRAVYIEKILTRDHISGSAHRYKVISHAPSSKNHELVNMISSDHPWSKVEVEVPARLTSLNPLVGSISLPYSMGTFTLARLEAPILSKALGRHPQIKITDMVERASSLQVSDFTHHGHFYLADVTQDEQLKLSAVLLTMVQDYYQKQFAATASATIQAAQRPVSIPVAAEPAKAIAEAAPAPLVSPAGVSGNLALKDPPPPVQSRDDDDISLDPETINTKIRREFFKDELELDLSFNWRKKIDWTLVKAISLFLAACAIMAFIISMATNIDESYYKDHGRQYSDFFLRMSNPALRKPSSTSPDSDGQGAGGQKD